MKKGPETLDRVMGYLTAEITVKVVVPKERPVCRYCQGWLDYARGYGEDERRA